MRTVFVLGFVGILIRLRTTPRRLQLRNPIWNSKQYRFENHHFDIRSWADLQ